MPRYKDYVKKMIDENKEAFAVFQRLHDEYALNSDILQDKYNTEGEKILQIVHEYENKVCANQGRGVYNKFSHHLADKFHSEVLKVFPMIDHIGLRVEKPPQYKINGSNTKTVKEIEIRKISINNQTAVQEDNSLSNNNFALKQIRLF